jgi:acyl carrier protein
MITPATPLTTLDHLKITLIAMGVDPDRLVPGVNVRTGLDLDSLDQLDLIYSVNKKFNIDLPLDQWVAAIDAGEPEDTFFRLDNFIAHIDRLSDHVVG